MRRITMLGLSLALMMVATGCCYILPGYPECQSLPIAFNIQIVDNRDPTQCPLSGGDAAVDWRLYYTSTDGSEKTSSGTVNDGGGQWQQSFTDAADSDGDGKADHIDFEIDTGCSVVVWVASIQNNTMREGDTIVATLDADLSLHFSIMQADGALSAAPSVFERVRDCECVKSMTKPFEPLTRSNKSVRASR